MHLTSTLGRKEYGMERNRMGGSGWFDPVLKTLDEVERLITEAYFGPPNIGYRWLNLFLPNGTMLRVRKGRSRYSAAVTHGELIFRGRPSSPAKMLRDITDEEPSEVWKKVLVSLPYDDSWRVASEVRKEFGTKDLRRVDRPRYCLRESDSNGV